jgi:CubicO group peptidase (beta-lactamase class C family)
MRLVVHAALLCLGAAPAGAQPGEPQTARQVSDFLGTEAAVFNGALVAAGPQQGEVRLARGMADFAASRPNHPDAVFQLASAAKPFTAIAVLQLRDKGRLALSDPVKRHLPGFPFPDITVRHLLSHTSGLPDLELFEPLVARAPAHVVTGRDLIPALQDWKQPLRFAAGEQFRYSNINYQLLAELVAAVSGRSFGHYLRDAVFRPAGMRSSYVLGTAALRTPGPPVARQVLAVMFRTTPQDIRTLNYSDPVLMRPYRYEGYNLGSTIGDQNLFSTLSDLKRFDQALRSGRLLSPSSQQEAYRPARLNNGQDYAEEQIYELYGAKCSYGLGWETCLHPTRGRLVGHAGYVRGIAVMLYRELDGGRFAAMFDNGDTGEFPKKFASVINILDGLPPLAITRTKSLTRAYGAALLSSGPVPALIRYNQLKANSSEWAGTPAGMNRLGYDLLRNGHPALALEAFRLNVALNPGAANLYDSWAEGLAANGYRREAIAAYRRSIELNPDNAAGREALAKLEAEALGEP